MAMPEQQAKKSKRGSMSEEAYDKLVQQVSERIWQIWMLELRRDRERRGGRRG
jgi:hypothetical protein